MTTDEQLIELIKRGEREVYGRLFSKYYERIYKICLSILKNRDDAEEVAQETFVYSYLKLNQLKNPEKFFAWLKAIARNRSIKYLHRSQKELVRPGVVTPPQIAPDELLLRQELIDAIMEAIEALPEKDRMVIQSRIEGLNHSEICERFGISIEASMSRLYRARKKIAAHVKDLLYAIVGLPKIFPLKKIVSGGILAMKASTSAKYAVIVLSALGIMFASFIGVKSYFSSPQKNAANLASNIPKKSSQRASPLMATAKKPPSVSTQPAPVEAKIEAKGQPRGAEYDKSEIDDERVGNVTEVLEFLDKLDKAAEYAAQNQKESDTSSIPTDKEMYLTGTELYKEKRYEEAVSVFDELVLQFPNSQYAE
ncbi:MAG: sigma-70 family RNA polymerase sigma factor, partial [Candidatus Poribacteria bacterium]